MYNNLCVPRTRANGVKNMIVPGFNIFINKTSSPMEKSFCGRVKLYQIP